MLFSSREDLNFFWLAGRGRVCHLELPGAGAVEGHSYPGAAAPPGSQSLPGPPLGVSLASNSSLLKDPPFPRASADPHPDTCTYVGRHADPCAHALSCDPATFFRSAGFLQHMWKRRASSDDDNTDRARGFSSKSPALKSVSSSVTQRGHARQPSSLQQPTGMGRVFKILHANRPTFSLPSVACPGYATCT